MTLAQQTCKPCETGEGKLSPQQALLLMGELDDWTFYPDRIEKRWNFKNFKQALTFVNEAGRIAEAAGHHPDIHFGWGYVEIVLTTHSAGGLTLNDFIVAARIDAGV